jgi:hypothetical protein
MALILIQNGPMPTTAQVSKVATGTALKTLLQVKPLMLAKVVEWGISFDGSAAAQPVQVDLVETGTVFATVSAFVAADITKFGNVADQVASDSLLSVGTSASGYTSTAEGTITQSRVLDLQLIAPTNQYIKQFPLGREPVIQIGYSGRIRVTAPASVNAYCYMILDI